MSRHGERFKELFEIDFVWRVPQNGFRWEHPPVLAAPTILPEYLVENECEETFSVKPFEENHIFANFAEITEKNKPFDESFLEHANQYGSLTCGEFFDFKDFMYYADAYHAGWAYKVEKKATWFTTHKELAFAFSIWQGIVNNDEERISRYFMWKELSGEPVRFGYYPSDKKRENTAGQPRKRFFSFPDIIDESGMKVIFSEKNSDWTTVKKLYPNIISPAARFIKDLIRKKLEKLSMGLSIQNISISNKQRLLVNDLLSAMWLQFFFYINQNIILKRCSYCNGWQDMGGNRRPSRWTIHPECMKKKELDMSKKHGEAID